MLNYYNFAIRFNLLNELNAFKHEFGFTRWDIKHGVLHRPESYVDKVNNNFELILNKIK